ncbi:MAG: polysaccharide biosynthesis/export family protein [Planctomycetota bacterium]
MNRLLQKILISTLVALACGAGCSRTDHRIPDSAPAEPPALYQPMSNAQGIPEVLLDRPPYRLSPGDVLEIIYQVKNIVSETPYELKIEDVIKLQFPYQERFDQKLTVQGDGHIRCLLLGQMRAAGRTSNDLEEQLRKGYSRYIKEPEVTVVVEAANQKITELKKAITTAPRGQSRLVPIKPDGTIDLPYVGEVLVAGRTVNQSKKLLDQLYVENDLREVEVTVQTLDFAAKNIYVMGEVLSPGSFQSAAPCTMIQALIRCGGPNGRAEKSKILLIRRQYLPLPQAVVFDMNQLLTATTASPEGRVPKGSEFRWDMYLADGDIIYVPPTSLAQATDWIDQVFTRGVRAVFPYSGVVGMNFGYQTYQAPSGITTKSAPGWPNVNTQVGP